MAKNPVRDKKARDKKARDKKAQALAEQGCLHGGAERVDDPLFAQDPFFDPRDVVQVKYEMLRRTRCDGLSVSAAAKAYGMSRPSFYHAQETFERQGLVGLLPRKRGPRQGHKLTEEVVAFLQDVIAKEGVMPSSALVKRVQERFDITVHSRSIERALARGKKKTR